MCVEGSCDDVLQVVLQVDETVADNQTTTTRVHIAFGAPFATSFIEDMGRMIYHILEFPRNRTT